VGELNNRRNLLIVLGTAPFAPRALFAQAEQPVLIGWLHFGGRNSQRSLLAALKEGLAALGWKEGSQFRIEDRAADGELGRLASLAQELAAKKPALIVAVSLSAATRAAKAAPEIPIVMVAIGDPITAGLVTNLARPGGMVTGLAGFGAELAGKHLELLLAATPTLKRIGFLASLPSRNRAAAMEAARRSAAHYAVEAMFAEVASPEDIEPAIYRLAKEGAQALVVLQSVLLAEERPRIVRLALAQRWPMVAGLRSFAVEGALLSYGSNARARFRRAAYYVDRILKGAKPGDIPIEQPMTFQFVVNLKTAKAFGITIPPWILLHADEVIQ
jgi:putative ABC transport system substrate-binding protein